jgi:hypothetical protein
MEKGVIKKASLLCVIVACAIIAGVVVAYTIDLKRYYDLRDPTYREALQFIFSDQTDKNQYNQSYNCVNFADDFVSNAIREGFRCGYVIVEFSETRHALVCFNTSDKGLIFVEPQNDNLVTLTTEQRFSITWRTVFVFPFMLVLSFLVLPLFMIATYRYSV